MTDFLFLLALYADRLAIAGGEDGGVEFNKAIGITPILEPTLEALV